MIRTTLVVAGLVLMFGCDSKSDAIEKGAPAKTPDKAPDKAPAAPEKPKIGLELPGNDAKVVALARKAIGCKFEKGSFESGCADYTAWKDEQDAFADNKVDATLVAFLEDPDEKVRALGAMKLNGWAGGAFADKALAERILTVVEKLKKDLPEAGRMVGHLKVKETETLPRIKALMASEDYGNMLRGDVVENLLAANPESDDIFTMTKDLIADAQLGRSAFLAFAEGGKSKAKETCELYQTLLENNDGFIASRAAIAIGEFPCADQFDALIKSLEARTKAKKLTEGRFAESLGTLCKAKDVKAPQTKKALALTHKIADDKKIKETYVRSSALEAAVACDAKGGKKYAAKFMKDEDADVKKVAEKLSK